MALRSATKQVRLCYRPSNHIKSTYHISITTCTTRRCLLLHLPPSQSRSKEGKSPSRLNSTSTGKLRSLFPSTQQSFLTSTFSNSIRKWVNGNGDALEVYNPATEEHITTVHTASPADVDLAVKAARTAFETTWGTNVPGSERGRLLYKFADVSDLLGCRVIVMRGSDE
jgi:hypothetical protein